MESQLKPHMQLERNLNRNFDGHINGTIISRTSSKHAICLNHIKPNIRVHV